MSIPTGSSNQSWTTASVRSEPVQLTLPTPYTITYTSDMGDYANCGTGNDYTTTLVPIGSSSVTNQKIGTSLVISWTFGSTTPPGVIDYITYLFRAGLTFSLEGILFHYGLNRSLSGSKGVVVTGSYGSPHVSIEHNLADSVAEKMPGDMWFRPTISGSTLSVVDKDALNQIYVSQILSAYVDETVLSLMAKMTGSIVRPINRYLALQSLIADQGFVTFISGSGIRNHDWDIGLYMPNSGSVAVYGNANFKVPSGSFYTYRGIIVNSGSITSTGFKINRGVGQNSVRIDTGSIIATNLFNLIGQNTALLMPGVSASMKIGSADVSVYEVTGSLTFDTESTPRFNGSLYVLSGSGNAGYVRVSGSWFTFYSSSASYGTFDGGLY